MLISGTNADTLTVGVERDSGGTLPIAVVVPAFNRAQFIAEALNSVFGQTRQPAEIIVVDDGSTDGTADIAEALGVKVLRQSNLGPSAARNAGVAATSQPWIAFLDSDDVWLPDKLESQWDALSRCPGAGVAFCDFSQFEDGRTVVASFFQGNVDYQRVQRSVLGPDSALCARESLFGGCYNEGGYFIRGSSLLVRRDVLNEAGLFDPDLHYWEDYELLARMFALTSAVVVERILWRQRIHRSNTTANHLEVLKGTAKVGDKVLRNAARYPSETVEHWRREQQFYLRRAGIACLQTGDLVHARRLLWQRALTRPTPVAIGTLFGALLLSVGGQRLYATLRRRAQVERSLSNGQLTKPPEEQTQAHHPASSA